MLAELGVAGAAREQMPRLRAVVATMILIGFSTLAVAWMVVIGLTIIPPWPVLVVLLLALAISVAFMWRRFSQLYARAQYSLRETLSQPPETTQHEKPLSSLLQDAQLETVHIVEGSDVAGRLIREIQLRSQTGASVVGIDRGGASIVNPGPDEELLVGDKVLLIGTSQHLEAARRLCAPTARGNSDRPE